FYQITEIDYFKDLGYDINYYNPSNGSLVKKDILNAIDYIHSKYKGEYPKFNPDASNLDFNSLVGFAKTYLLMIRNFDLSKSTKEA
ncbi:MAG: hypothetical protein AAGK97_15975, partial [Bacteroidota bacterium]